jgi:hypothetical protein
MAARLWTALLVLVGVFVMHGAQCAAAADDAGHLSPVAHSTALPPTGTLMHGAVEAAATVATVTDMALAGSAVADTAPAAQPATGSPTAVATADSPPSGSHGTAGHLWTVCMAVLAAAMAVLLALLLPHPGLLARLALTRVRSQLRSLTPTRPPDLSELCLLRI